MTSSKHLPLARWAELAHIGLIFIDAGNIVKIINPYAELLLGVKAKYCTNRSLDEIFKRKYIPERLYNSIINNLICTCTHNGFNITITTVPLNVNSGKYGTLVLISNDVDIKTTSRIKCLEKFYYYVSRTLNSVFEDFAIVDGNGKYIYISEKTAHKLGITFTIEKDNAIAEITERAASNCILNKVLKTGKGSVVDVWKTQDHMVPAMFLPLYDDDSKLIGAACKSIFRDIEEAKEFAKKYCYTGKDNERKRTDLKKLNGVKFTFDDIIGESKCIKDVKLIAQRAAQTDLTVLILGKTGTGKELFAHAIHAASSRHEGPFIRVNCAAIPEALLESELFGYEEGAFSGAQKGGKRGKFELANRGTIFLDEIGDMGLNMQTKLLRVLQEREIERVGGGESLEIDVRVIAATNQDLREKVRKNLFREDLYYRLDILSLPIPSLEDRKDDLPLMVEYLLSKMNYRNKTRIHGITKDVIDIFNEYSWPGNIRELENVLESSACFCRNNYIDVDHLPLRFKQNQFDLADLPGASEPQNGNGIGSKICVGDIEKKAIMGALQSTGGNRKEAAILLGMPRSSFYYKLKRYNISI